MKFAFILMGSGFDSEKDRAAIHGGEIQVAGVPDLSEGCRVAKELCDSGVNCIELCGAFGPESSSWPFFAWLSETYNTPWVRTALNIIGLLSLAFITFSREKVEDEMMDRLRLSTIGAVAAAYLILYIVVSIVWSLCMTDGLRDYIVANGYEFGFYLRAEQLWLLYVIIFKLRVIVGNRRVPDEQERNNRSGKDGNGRRCQSTNGRRCQSGNGRRCQSGNGRR